MSSENLRESAGGRLWDTTKKPAVSRVAHRAFRSLRPFPTAIVDRSEPENRDCAPKPEWIWERLSIKATVRSMMFL